MNIIVGTNECDARDVVRTILQDPLIIKKWTILAFELGISTQDIYQITRKQTLHDWRVYDIINEILVLWVGKEGSSAKLSRVINILEEKCEAGGVGECLRLKYNLPSKLCDIDGESWEQLSPEFKDKVNQAIKEFWPDIPHDQVDTSQLERQALCDLVNGRKPTIFHSNIPQRRSYYINRVILTRDTISPRIFKDNLFPDLLLISGMDRSKLSEFVSDHVTSTTTEQLDSAAIDAKFMVLDQPLHLEKMYEKFKKAVHHLHYNEGKLKWVKSKPNPNSLRKFVDSEQDELPEKEFLKEISEQNTPKPICTSDSPGMGKTVLLAEIARNLKTRRESEVIFLECNQLVEEIRDIGAMDLKEAIKASLIKLTCKNQLGSLVLEAILGSNKKQVELLLDAFDEVDPTNYKLTLKVLKLIQDEFHSIRLFITTRPHLMEELENNLSVLGYTIKAFDEGDQIRFLITYWKQKCEENLDKERLERFAIGALKTAKGGMKPGDEDICGVPLQCMLIAEVFEKEAVDFAKTNCSKLPKLPVSSMTDLYRRMIEKKIAKYIRVHAKGKSSQPYGTKELMKLHTKFSLKLLFKLNYSFNDEEMSQLLNVGIMEKSIGIGAFRFVHFTFAEYFAAKYVADLLASGGGEDGIQDCPEIIDFIIQGVLRCRQVQVQILDEEIIPSCKFQHHTICYFVNCMTNQAKLKANVVQRLMAKSNKAQAILHACANDNFLSLFKGFWSPLPKTDKEKDLVLLTIRNSSIEFARTLLELFNVVNVYDIQFLMKLLRVAVQRGDYTIVEYLLKEKMLMGVVQQLKGAARLLMHDCVVNSKYLTDADIDQKTHVLNYLARTNKILLEQKDDQGRTPLLAGFVHVELLIELVKNGANVMAQDNEGDTVLHLSNEGTYRRCSANDYFKILNSISPGKLKGILATTAKDEQTPLMRLLSWIDPTPETLQLFYEADPEAGRFQGALKLAVIKRRNNQTISKLIQLTGGTETPGSTSLLHVSASYGNTEATEVLVEEHGLDVNIEDGNGMTPLDYAVARNTSNGSSGFRFEAGVVLIKHGGMLKASTKNYTVAELLDQALKEGNKDSARLLQYILDTTVGSGKRESQSKTTTVTDLSDEKYSALIRQFLDSQGRLYYRDSFGNSLLHISVQRKDEQAIKNLLRLEVCVNGKNKENETPLLLTSTIPDLDICIKIITILIEHGAGVEAKDTKNATFLHRLLADEGPVKTPLDFHKISEYIVSRGLARLFNIPGLDNAATPFALAVVHFEVKRETLQLLQENGVDFNAISDSYKKSILMNAVEAGRCVELLSNLIHFGADPKYKDDMRTCLLQYAAINSRLDVVKYLLDLGGFEMNTFNNHSSTPLHGCIIWGKENVLEIAKLLIENGADRTLKNFDNRTPLDCAIWRQGTNERLLGLLEFGLVYLENPTNEMLASAKMKMDFTEWRETSLHKAVDGFQNRDDCISMLKDLIGMASEADIFAKNEHNDTFLHKLFNDANQITPQHLHELAEYLIEKNYAKIFDSPGGTQGGTPLHRVMAHIDCEVQTLYLFYQNGVNFHARALRGQTCFNYAVIGKRKIEVLETLLKMGVDCKTVNRHGDTLLVHAAYFGTLEALQFLLKLDCIDINQKNIVGNTPLHYAVQNKDTKDICEMARTLVVNGAIIDLLNNEGLTPLQIALNNDNLSPEIKIELEIILKPVKVPKQ